MIGYRNRATVGSDKVGIRLEGCHYVIDTISSGYGEFFRSE